MRDYFANFSFPKGVPGTMGAPNAKASSFNTLSTFPQSTHDKEQRDQTGAEKEAAPTCTRDAVMPVQTGSAVKACFNNTLQVDAPAAPTRAHAYERNARPLDKVYYQERFAERSAIMEVDGKSSPKDAELQAFREVLHEYLSIHYPFLIEEYGCLIYGTEQVH